MGAKLLKSEQCSSPTISQIVGIFAYFLNQGTAASQGLWNRNNPTC